VWQQTFVWLAGNHSGGLHVGTRIAAGLTTGALAVLIAQPTDVVKVRLQAQQRTQGTGTVPRYTSTLQAYQTIARQEGARGLWKGEPHV
jgi:solute carrier family 25 uncoupling protein 8/9